MRQPRQVGPFDAGPTLALARRFDLDQELGGRLAVQRAALAEGDDARRPPCCRVSAAPGGSAAMKAGSASAPAMRSTIVPSSTPSASTRQVALGLDARRAGGERHFYGARGERRLQAGAAGERARAAAPKDAPTPCRRRAGTSCRRPTAPARQRKGRRPCRRPRPGRACPRRARPRRSPRGMLAARSAASKEIARGPFMPKPTSMPALLQLKSAGPGMSGDSTCTGEARERRAVRGAKTETPPLRPARRACVPLRGSATEVSLQEAFSEKGKPVRRRSAHSTSMPRSSISREHARHLAFGPGGGPIPAAAPDAAPARRRRSKGQEDGACHSSPAA